MEKGEEGGGSGRRRKGWGRELEEEGVGGGGSGRKLEEEGVVEGGTGRRRKGKDRRMEVEVVWSRW